ncbi:MAG: hypothetical protein M1831_005424 [Alyxoria varia]|nr:MAG: hypothetical protein M1831_005424 [Alyxoria varia]
MALASNSRYVMYLTGFPPEKDLLTDLTHVALAFMSPATFMLEAPTSWPLFTSVEKARSQFAPGTAIMVAIGGWGDTAGFDLAAATDASRKHFAQNVKRMVDETGADGVDIDWEYPGGNGEDYKQIPNAAKAWEIEAYPILLSEIRSALGPDKVISAAVPGLRRDMLAFTKDTIPNISRSLDFFNVMTYDLMNRRDNITKHHTGIDLSLDSVNAYEERGVPCEKMNLGFAFYIRWFKTDPAGGCDKNSVGCKTALMEDPATGADLGRAGAFAWHDPVPEDLSVSYARAMANGKFDPSQGGHYYWDPDENIWWTWDTADMIMRKFPAIMEKKRLGGSFAWGLGEDGDKFVHFRALTAAMREFRERSEERGFDVTSALDANAGLQHVL